MAKIWEVKLLNVPKNDLKEVLKYLDLNNFDFEEIINKHRNGEVWKKDNNSWKLKDIVYE